MGALLQGYSKPLEYDNGIMSYCATLYLCRYKCHNCFVQSTERVCQGEWVSSCYDGVCMVTVSVVMVSMVMVSIDPYLYHCDHNGEGVILYSLWNYILVLTSIRP